MKNLLIFISLILFFTACERASDDTSRISIQMPGNSSSFASNRITSLNNVGALGDWLPIVPSGFSGSEPINCYFVAVSGPDPALNSRACYQTDANNVNLPTFNYGFLAGPVAAGEILELSVPSGPDRVFRLMGMYANSAADCNANFTKQYLSKPYKVGEVGAVNLVPNVEAQVTIPISFDSSKYVDGCDLVAPPVAPTAPPTHINVQFATPIFGQNVYNGQCLPVNVFITDLLGSVIFPTRDPIPNLQFVDNSMTIKSSFESFNACSTGTPVATSSFYFPANSFVEKRWLYVDSGWAGKIHIGLQNTPASLAVRTNPLRYNTAFGGSDFVYAAQVPTFIKNGTCYPIHFTRRSINSSGDPSLASADVTVSASVAGGSFTFYGNDPNCSGGGAASTYNQTYTLASSDTTYVRFANVPIGTAVGFKIERQANFTDTTEFKSLVKDGDNDSNRFRIKGLTELKRLSNDTCYGPYKLFLHNNLESEVSNNSGADRNFRFSLPLTASGVELSLAPNCNTTINPTISVGTTHLTIAANRTSEVFFVKVRSNAISGDKTIKVHDDARSMSFDLKIRVNVP